MKLVVIGCGSIGRRHIGNLLSLGAELIACDTASERRAQVASDYGVEVRASLAEVWPQKPAAAVICTPTRLHHEQALEASMAGCHLFVEKPLSHTLHSMDELVGEVQNKSLISMVGSNFKFHPSFLKMKEILDSGILGRILSARCQFGQYLPDWNPWRDYRNSYSARSDLGGGILLDSHEFDYLRWFLGDVSEVFCLARKLSDLDIDTEDTAEAVLWFQNGSMGAIHLDYTQRSYQRNYEFFGEKGTLKWDFTERKVWLYRADSRSWEVFDEPRNYHFNEMYVDEMRHFIDCVRLGRKPVTDIHDGLKTLETIMAAKRSAKEGRMVPLEVLP